MYNSGPQYAYAIAQPYTDNVGIGTATPDPSALLHLESTEKGLLIPKMTQLERDQIVLPATGLMIFNITANAFQYNIGTPVNPIWVSLLSISIDGSSTINVFWSILGNDSINRAEHFLGTTNAAPIIIRTDSVIRAIFEETGGFDLLTPTTIDASLNLLGDTTSLMMDSDPGIEGAPLVSQGPSATPEWYTGILDAGLGYRRSMTRCSLKATHALKTCLTCHCSLVQCSWAIRTTCDPGFGAVGDAFTENFDHGDLGASCAVTVEGELKVDLWGGFRDPARTRPWEQDTIVNVWSSTKTVAALCVLMLHDRGELSVDEPMAAYWPEFAAAGKESVLVRHVLGHTAGLAAFDDVPDDLTVFDWTECCRRLAGQAPRWEPGDGSGYHAETQGWLLGELIRRVDGRTLGTFLREEVTAPLAVDLHVGLADEHHHRVADMSSLAAEPNNPRARDLQAPSQAASRRSASLVNTGAWRRAELPASNGHGNARSLALALAPLANGGASGGTRLLGPDTIDRVFEVQADGVDRILGRHMRFGMGYGLVCDATPMGVNDRTCWWAGWGGSMCVVDVENRTTVSYTMNRMLGEDDLRAIRVVFAAHGSVT